MAKFLTTRGTASRIEEIINDAHKRLVLISPFVRIPESLYQCIKTADKRGVKTSLVYGKKELDPGVLAGLKQLANLSLYFERDLHAKCFFNEKSMVITSMNLYDFSELRNKEMGILVSAQEDPDIYRQAVEEANRIVEFADPILLSVRSNNGPAEAKAAKVTYDPIVAGQGNCIRCGTKIPFDIDKPYCPACFKVWSEWKNPDHKEQHCFLCGEFCKTTIDYPLCSVCYRRRKSDSAMPSH